MSDIWKDDFQIQCSLFIIDSISLTVSGNSSTYKGLKISIPLNSASPCSSIQSRSNDFHTETRLIDDQHIAKRELHAHCILHVSPNVTCP